MSMRKTVRPVTLSRIVETVDICHQHSAVDASTIQDTLDLSERRTSEIIAELTRLSLIQQDDHLSLTATGTQFYDAVQREDWHGLHDILYQASPHYQVFINLLQDRTEETGYTEKQLLSSLDEKDHSLRFNKTGVSLLADWGERLKAIQRNVFENRHYPVQVTATPDRFVTVLQNTYDEMEVTRGLGMRQRYISIPKLRERVCESLRLSRDAFDHGLIAIAQENIGRMELSGAPLDTQAKESQLEIKTIQRSTEDDVVTTSMTSDRVLSGITMPDGKTYYYLTIFEQLMDGETE